MQGFIETFENLLMFNFILSAQPFSWHRLTFSSRIYAIFRCFHVSFDLAVLANLQVLGRLWTSELDGGPDVPVDVF